jgi:phosphohistidine phosphatase
LRFDAVIASPATRVAETLQEVEAVYGPGLAPSWQKSLYLATPDELLDAVHQAPAEAESILLVGHNPGLEQLVLMLVPDRREGARGEVEVKYPTASLAEMTFAVDRWEDVDRGGGDLVRFVRPRDLDPELGPDYA